MLKAARSIDIIVPLRLGICSLIKLLADEVTIPKNQLANNIARIESETLGTRTYDTVNIPDNRAVRTVEGFLPNLFTNRCVAKLPRAKDNAAPSSTTDASSVGIKNRCLKNDVE